MTIKRSTLFKCVQHISVQGEGAPTAGLNQSLKRPSKTGGRLLYRMLSTSMVWSVWCTITFP